MSLLELNEVIRAVTVSTLTSFIAFSESFENKQQLRPEQPQIVFTSTSGVYSFIQVNANADFNCSLKSYPQGYT